MAQVNIENGPSKWDFILSLGDGDSFHRKTVSFQLEQSSEKSARLFVPVVINQVQRADGSGCRWNFEAFLSDEKNSVLNNKVVGFYSTQTRSGWLKILDSHHA